MVEQEVFQLIKASLFTDEAVDMGDWKAVFEEMKAQSVAALPGEWLKKHPVPGASAWSTYCYVQQGQWLRVMHGQDQLLKLLDEHGIPCVILKGAAAAMAYPVPALRSMGDVDFLVKRCDFERSLSVLEENEYQLEFAKKEEDHHCAYSKDSIRIEPHIRVAPVQESDEYLLTLFENGIDHREIHSIGGFQFPVLPADLNGLVLIFHIDGHLRGGIGLRQIIDWMMYIDKLPEDVWEEKLLPLLRETGMEKLALTVTAMCQKYLGLRTIVVNTEDLPCDALMAHIMKKGNFGRKAGSEGKISSVFFIITNPIRAFRRLQAGGLARWKAAREYKVLRPFAWIYQGFYILGYFIRHKVGPGDLVRQHRKGLEERELIESLGLKIDREIEIKGR